MSSDPFGRLSEFNYCQIRKYLNFFRGKRQSSLRALTQEFADIKHDRFTDDMYSREDVEEGVDFLLSAVQNQMSHDIGAIVNMGALTLAQLLESAQDKGLELDLEVSSAENQVLLDSIEKMSLEALPKSVRRGIDELPSFKEETRSLRAEADRLEDSYRSLQESHSALQNDMSKLSREKSAMANEIADLKMALLQSGRASESKSGDEIRELREELKRVNEELDKKFQNTDQYQRMKAMMLAKGDKVRELRRRLERYEPDNTKDDDD